MKLRIILIVAVIALAAGNWKLYSLYVGMRSEKENVQSLYSNKTNEIEVYKSRDGQMVTRNEAVSIENKTLKQIIKDGQFSQVKNLEGLNKRMNNLETLYQLSLTVQDSLRLKLQIELKKYIAENGDTVLFQATNFKYSDKWSNFKASQVTPDSADFIYTVSTGDVTGAFYWKRKHPILWVFSKKEYWGEVTAENPHVAIPKLTNIRVGKK